MRPKHNTKQIRKLILKPKTMKHPTRRSTMRPKKRPKTQKTPMIKLSQIRHLRKRRPGMTQSRPKVKLRRNSTTLKPKTVKKMLDLKRHTKLSKKIQ